MADQDCTVADWLRASSAPQHEDRIRALRAVLVGQPGTARRLRRSKQVARRVTELLGDEASRVRFVSAVVLCRLRDTDSLPALQALIGAEDDWHTRCVAAEAIGNQGGAPALEILRAALEQETETQALPSYALALGKAGEADAISDLLVMAGSDDWRVRWGAARGLEQLRHPAAIRLADELAADPRVSGEERAELLRWRTCVRRRMQPRTDERGQP